MQVRKFTVLIIILLVAVVGVFGVAFFTQQASDQSASDLVESEEIDTSDLSSEDLSTEGWKTYRNEELGFEFKYPLESDRFLKVPSHEIKFIKNKLEVASSVALETFNIGAKDPANYIKDILLKDADINCIVKILENPERLPENYNIYFIQGTDPTDPEIDGYSLLYQLNCTGYAGAGANAYFIHNKYVSNKLLHIAIYQDPSMSQKQIDNFIKSLEIF